MTGLGERAEEAALWQRWRALSPTVAAAGAPVDPGELAAYAEGRLDEAAAAAAEAWMFAHPEALDDVAAARALAAGEPPAATAAMLAGAMALVAPRAAEIVPFPQRVPERRRALRAAVAWGGLAASLLVTSLFGFTLGSNAYLNLAGPPAATESTFHELLDPPGGLFSNGGEEEI